MMEGNQQPVTWESFRRAFLDKYFPASARAAREAQFLRLRQGGMSVAEYAAKLESLAKHFRYFQGKMDEDYMCERFIDGLNYELQRAVQPLSLNNTSYLLKRPKESRRSTKQGTDTKDTASLSKEAEESNGLIRSTGEIAGNPLTILFDFGATHSFVDVAYASRLNLKVSKLPFDLIVSIPASESLTTNTACLECPWTYRGKKLVANLICLPLKGLDVIIGMDWMSHHHVLLDCANK